MVIIAFLQTRSISVAKRGEHRDPSGDGHAPPGSCQRLHQQRIAATNEGQAKTLHRQQRSRQRHISRPHMRHNRRRTTQCCLCVPRKVCPFDPSAASSHRNRRRLVHRHSAHGQPSTIRRCCAQSAIDCRGDAFGVVDHRYGRCVR